VFPAVLWSVTVVLVPFQDAGKLASNTGMTAAFAAGDISAIDPVAAENTAAPTIERLFRDMF
jgi:hypothetical protein